MTTSVNERPADSLTGLPMQVSSADSRKIKDVFILSFRLSDDSSWIRKPAEDAFPPREGGSTTLFRETVTSSMPRASSSSTWKGSVDVSVPSTITLSRMRSSANRFLGKYRVVYVWAEKSFSTWKGVSTCPCNLKEASSESIRTISSGSLSTRRSVKRMSSGSPANRDERPAICKEACSWSPSA